MNQNMEIKQRNIGEITPYLKNAKEHPEDQIQKIANSIKEFGFNQPIVVDAEDVIIVGHGRYEAAKKLGMETVPVFTASLSETQAKAYRLADNKLNESKWDMGLVMEEIKELELEGIDINLTGFGNVTLDDIPEAQEAPEPDHKTKTCPECGYEF